MSLLEAQRSPTVHQQTSCPQAHGEWYNRKHAYMQQQHVKGLKSWPVLVPRYRYLGRGGPHSLYYMGRDSTPSIDLAGVEGCLLQACPSGGGRS